LTTQDVQRFINQIIIIFYSRLICT